MSDKNFNMRRKIGFARRRGWLLPLMLLFALVLALASGRHGSRSTRMKKDLPNIVLLLADDLGYGDLGCYGATKVATPVIDNLALEGVSFTQAYVTSSLCTPSRYSILTGRYPWRTRLKSGVLKYFERPLIEKNETTLASMLKSKGYYTVCIGKWHLGLDWQVNDKAPENPEETVFNSWGENLTEYIDFTKPVGSGPVQRGFDYFFGMSGSNNMQPYVLIENNRVLEVPSIQQKPYDHYINALRAPNWNIKTINEDLTRKAVEKINDHFQDNKSKPLFLYFPTSAIHRPCLPTFTKGKSKAGLRGDIVEELDWTVNEIITALKKNNAYDNTLFIFTSDNGPRPGDPALWMNTYANGDYEDYHQPYFDDYKPEYIDPNGNKIWKEGWFTYGHAAAGDLLGFKSDAWNGGLSVPFIVRWPGKVPAGTKNANYICLSDILATLAEVVGYKLDSSEGQDSYSFLSNLLNTKSSQVRESLILAGGSSGAMIAIKDNWKFIEAAEPGKWPETYYPNGPSKFDRQLYNLEIDKSEHDNLYNKNPGKVAELESLIKKVKSHAKTEGIENN
jgi:arylsulfatase A